MRRPPRNVADPLSSAIRRARAPAAPIASERPTRNLLDLPDECLESILTSVVPLRDCFDPASGYLEDARLASLAALALVCRRLYPIAQAHLGRTLCIGSIGRLEATLARFEADPLAAARVERLLIDGSSLTHELVRLRDAFKGACVRKVADGLCLRAMGGGIDDLVGGMDETMDALEEAAAAGHDAWHEEVADGVTELLERLDGLRTLMVTDDRLIAVRFICESVSKTCSTLVIGEGDVMEISAVVKGRGHLTRLGVLEPTPGSMAEVPCTTLQVAMFPGGFDQDVDLGRLCPDVVELGLPGTFKHHVTGLSQLQHLRILRLASHDEWLDELVEHFPASLRLLEVTFGITPYAIGDPDDKRAGAVESMCEAVEAISDCLDAIVIQTPQLRRVDFRYRQWSPGMVCCIPDAEDVDQALWSLRERCARAQIILGQYVAECWEKLSDRRQAEQLSGRFPVSRLRRGCVAQLHAPTT